MKKNRQLLIAGGILGGTLLAGKLIKKKNWSNRDNGTQTVLITGASGGLGLELAKEFAKNGYNLVIAARSEEKLESLKTELEKQYDVDVVVIAVDLSEEGGAQNLYEEVKKKGIVINQLVNNAGVGKENRVIDCDVETLQNIIKLNVESVTILCRLFGADMAEQGQGRIMNVSSLGAFIPDPYFNVYGPSKAFELFLTLAMKGELENSGVSVSVLCPGPMKTNWAANAGKADSKTARDPKDIAEIGYKEMQNGELVIVPGKVYRIEKKLMKHLSYTTQVNIIRKWQSKLIEKDKKKV